MGTASGCDDSNTPVDISLKCGPNEFLVSDGTGVENCFDKQLIDIFCDKNDCSKLTIVAPDIPEEIKLENIVLEPTSTPRPPEAYPEPLKDEEKVHGIQVITFESDVSRMSLALLGKKLDFFFSRPGVDKWFDAEDGLSWRDISLDQFKLGIGHLVCDKNGIDWDFDFKLPAYVYFNYVMFDKDIINGDNVFVVVDFGEGYLDPEKGYERIIVLYEFGDENTPKIENPEIAKLLELWASEIYDIFVLPKEDVNNFVEAYNKTGGVETGESRSELAFEAIANGLSSDWVIEGLVAGQEVEIIGVKVENEKLLVLVETTNKHLADQFFGSNEWEDRVRETEKKKLFWIPIESLVGVPRY